MAVADDLVGFGVGLATLGGAVALLGVTKKTLLDGKKKKKNQGFFS